MKEKKQQVTSQNTHKNQLNKVTLKLQILKIICLLQNIHVIINNNNTCTYVEINVEKLIIINIKNTSICAVVNKRDPFQITCTCNN